MYSKSILNDIRERVSIVSLVGERVPLKRAGRNFKGRCPFHNEKTPSFNVSDDRGIYHCFGCGEGGDIFQFVMKFEGMSFSEAVQFLASRAGIELPRDIDSKERAAEEEVSRKKRLCFRVNEIARDYFASRLFDDCAGRVAREYLQARGIKEEFFKQLFLGFADNSWDALSFHLKEKNVPQELAIELGLLKKKDSGGCYDFFRNRIMFPVISPRGEVLAFSGRDLSGGEAAKYLNSPDSIIYHKSNCVFGLDKAQNAIRSEDSVLLVEGNLDLASLHQAGIANVVAPLGTALTAGHLRLLKRYTRNMFVVFDGDEAGSRAAMRALETFIEEGLSPRIVPMPKGEDPDSLVRKEGPEVFRKRIAGAPSLFEYFVDEVLVATGADATGKVGALGKIVPLVAAVGDPAERSVYRRHVARRLDIDESAVEDAARKLRIQGGRATEGVLAIAGTGKKEVSVKKTDGMVMRSAESVLIETMLGRPEMAEKIFGELDVSSFTDGWCSTVAGLIRSKMDEGGRIKLNELIEGLADQELAAQIRQMALGEKDLNDREAGELVDDCIARLKERPQIARLESLNDDIRRAESEGDDARLMSLLQEKKELSMRIHGGMKEI